MVSNRRLRVVAVVYRTRHATGGGGVSIALRPIHQVIDDDSDDGEFESEEKVVMNRACITVTLNVDVEQDIEKEIKAIAVDATEPHSPPLAMPAVALRPDGRAPEMLRRQRLHRKYIDGARGSARYDIDGTIVTCAVYGPQEVKPWKEDVERGVIEVEIDTANLYSREDERALESRVRGALETALVTYEFPTLGVRFALRVVSVDGNVEAACINAACCAIEDAGLPRDGLLCASSCAILGDGTMVIDPTMREERDARAVVRASALDKKRDHEEIAIVGCSTTGTFTEDEFLNAIALIVDATTSVANFQKKSIARFELEDKLHEDAAAPTEKRPRTEVIEGLDSKPIG